MQQILEAVALAQDNFERIYKQSEGERGAGVCVCVTVCMCGCGFLCECVLICLSVFAFVSWSAFELMWRCLYASLCVHSGLNVFV